MSMNTHYQPITPIIKVVGAYCNLKCHYCFFNTFSQSIPQVMELGVLEEVIKQFLQHSKSKRLIRFIWHGGEPLLAGLEFFQNIITFQEQYNIYDCPIRNSLQTNGTLVTKEWAEWFGQHNFHVGVSIDGSPQSHNLMRTNMGGGDTWYAAVRGFKLLKEYGNRSGVLMVVHAQNASLAKESIEALRHEGVDKIGFNPYFESDHNRNHSFNSNLFLTPQKRAIFLKDAVDMWLEADDSEFSIREIDDFIAMYAGVSTGSCVCNGSCGNFVNIDIDGSVYPCERIPQSASTYFGNIMTEHLADILQSSNRMKFLDRVAYRPDDCLTCEMHKYCNNGCTHHRVDGKYYFCETRKELNNYLKNKIGTQVTLLQTQPSKPM